MRNEMKGFFGANDESRSNEALIRAWARSETFPWRRRRIAIGAALQEFDKLNETLATSFLYRFEKGGVSLIEKPEDLRHSTLVDRAKAYLRFFQAVIDEMPFHGEISLVLGVGDGPLDSAVAPTFSFQKPVGHPTILVNDVNMIEGEFYEPTTFLDKTSFNDKKHMAMFVGSTSGRHNSVSSVRDGLNKRIEAALYFKNYPEVKFSLPNIVQCDAEAEALIRTMDLGSQFIDWASQFEYRFLLSLDGNGAACQRIAVALKSGCVLLKYDSESLLYYFRGIVPWYHYIPIGDNSEVINVIAASAVALDQMAAIAVNGQIFFRNFLSRRAQYLYFRHLLEEYACIFNCP